MNDQFNLLVFPFAGATARLFLPLRKFLNPDINLIPIDPPGHGARYDETPLSMMEDIVSNCYNQIKDKTSIPYAIYGHSFGGRVVEALTRKLLEKDERLPVHLFLSGCAPSFIKSPLNGIEKLPDEAFLAKLDILGGSFPSKEEFPEYYEQFIKVLRSDFSSLSNYSPGISNPINIPLTLFWSREDVVKTDSLKSWRKVFCGDFNTIELKGNHFFPLQNFKYIGKEINNTIVRAIQDDD